MTNLEEISVRNDPMIVNLECTCSRLTSDKVELPLGAQYLQEATRNTSAELAQMGSVAPT